MKSASLFFLFFATPFALFAQNNDVPLFRPTKISYYAPEPGLAVWKLYQRTSILYNTHGDALKIVSNDAEGTPLSMDSIIFTLDFKIKEIHKKVYDQKLNSFVPVEKLVNTFDTEGNSLGALMYSWKGLWELESGSEHIRTWDAVQNAEIITGKVYNKTTEEWKALSKVVTSFNNNAQKDTITTYIAEPSGTFIFHTREVFSGWHNYPLNIYQGNKKERFENNTWITESESTIHKSGEVWIKQEERLWGPTAGRYKLIFAEDSSYQEFMKFHDPGWLLLMEHSKTSTLDKVVQNGFSGDELLKIQTDEKEQDLQGNQIRNTRWVRNPDGAVSDFFEQLHGLIYDSRNLLVVDSILERSQESGPYLPIEKIVYSDYVDVKAVTGTLSPQKLAPLFSIFPNPTQGAIHFSSEVEIEEVSVYNAVGKLVKTITPVSQTVDLSFLPDGLYTVKCLGDGQVLTSLIVIDNF